MARRRLVVSATASRQIRDADRWWAENREAAPGLLGRELQQAVERIVGQPGVGSIATNVEMPGVRRVLLPRTRYHLYYRPLSDAVEVMGLWHASRGEPPELA